MKKTKKYADGGMAQLSKMVPGANTNIGLTGIRDAASDLIGTAEGVSKMSQSLVGGGGGIGTSTPGQEVAIDTFGSAAQNLNQLGVGFKKGGKVSSASKRGDGIAQRGKTRGRMV